MSHTAKAMLPAIGQQVNVRCEDLQILCTVTDVKSAYGVIRLQVQPVAGTGSQWVQLERITLAAAAPKGLTV